MTGSYPQFETKMMYRMVFVGGYSKDYGKLKKDREYFCFITFEVDANGRPVIFLECSTGLQEDLKIRYSTLLRLCRDWKMKESFFMEDNHYKLRPYQEAAVTIAIESLGEHQKGRSPSIICLPTGSGKSLVIADLCHKLNKKTLILQPSKEILEQNFAKLQAYGVEDVKIYSASCNSREVGKFTYATIGSIKDKIDLFSDIEYLIIDECHLATKEGSMIDKFVKLLPKYPKIVGLTATPYILQPKVRKLPNGYILTQQQLVPLTRCYPCKWRKIAFNVNTAQLLKEGYLAPLEYAISNWKCKRLKVNTVGSEFTSDSLREYGNESLNHINSAIKYALDAGRKKILVFTPDLATAKALSEVTNYPFVHGEMSKREREKVLADFTAGNTPVAFNYGVLTTGFDFPDLDCVVCARPTLSLALWYQMLGRGLRIANGKKDCLVCDLSGNAERLGKVETIKMKKETGGFKDEVWTSAGKISNVALNSFVVKG